MGTPALHADDPGQGAAARGRAPAMGAARTARVLPAALIGWIAGTALQLHQASLWPGPYYTACALLGAVASLLLACWRKPALWPDRAFCCLAAAALAFGLAGLRAANQAQTTLSPALEGVDLQVEGVVVAMPLPVTGGQRFRLKTERAWREGAPVVVPPLMDLSWYRADHRAFARVAPEQPASAEHALPLLLAGQRWRVRGSSAKACR